MNWFLSRLLADKICIGVGSLGFNGFGIKVFGMLYLGRRFMGFLAWVMFILVLGIYIIMSGLGSI